MPQIFHKSANALARVSIVLGLGTLAGLVWAGATISTSGYVTGEDVVISQPVPFSHDHHFKGLGIHCLYCHTTVEESAFAGIPPTETCMNCHKEIWTNAELLEPLRESYRSGIPIEWERLHDTPDYVYFNHSVHIAKGIGCESCHGRVDEMPLMIQAESLTMAWCLDCHRDPAQHVRPREEIYTFGWVPPIPQSELGPQLVEEYEIQSVTNCSACHY
ncbi:MAG: cytochrome c3 family protein [Acidobacteriota bacterium]